MRMSILAIATALLAHHPLAAQSNDALESVAEGWGRGDWVLLTHVWLNPAIDRWEEVEDSPWTRWTVERVGPQSIEYTTTNGTPTIVELSDGIYRDSGVGEGSIVEHGIFGPENWRVLVLFPSPPGTPPGLRYYSELVIAGDVFVWTNWIEDEVGVRRRVQYSASQLAGRQPL